MKNNQYKKDMSGKGMDAKANSFTNAHEYGSYMCNDGDKAKMIGQKLASGFYPKSDS